MSERKRDLKRAWLWGLIAWLVTLVLALMAGYVASLRIVSQPAIVTIQIREPIVGEYADDVSAQLREADADPAVAGVVLEIDSPGGDASDSERLYFEVLQLREKKPVVAYVDGLGTSGAYFIACAADPVLASGLSFVGNVGVHGPRLKEPPPSEDYLVSGPYKLTAGSEEEQVRQFELLRQRFLQAVLAQRAERLGVHAALLPRGEAYYGVQALQMGLIDEVGTLADAREAAARLAGVRGYRAVTSRPTLAQEVLDALGFHRISGHSEDGEAREP